MTSNYPGGLDSHETNHADSVNEIIHADDINDQADAINKIEAELGTNPRGASATVKARLDAISLGNAPYDFYTLNGATNVGATSITVDRSVALATSGMTFVAVEPFSANCEIRRVTTISGVTASFTAALANAHSSGKVVLLFQDYSVPAAWFGCVGDGTTDDSISLQQAIRETQVAGIALIGGNRVHLVSQPILLGSSATLTNLNIKAKSTFAPVDTNNAIAMSYQGNVRTFTSATDTFTTPTAHGIPSDGVPVVFKGTSLPSGITAGRVYYAYNRASLTFKVSATRGGSMITAGTGSGTVYCEVQSMTKVGLRNVLIDGANVTGINGMIASLQQPSFLDKVRIDNCPGFGLAINGQQACFENFESIGCGTALEIDGAQFLYFDGFNAEQCLKAIHTRTTAQSLWGAPNNGSILFNGLHIEMNAGTGRSTSASIVFDLEGSFQNFDFNNVHISMSDAAQRIWYVHTAGGASDSSYSIRGVSCNVPAATGVKMLQDTDRGITLDSWDDCRNVLRELHAPLRPTSYLYTDPGPIRIIGPAGRMMEFGGTVDGVASQRSTPSTTQGGAQTMWRTSAAVDATWVNKGGYLMTALHSAPADGDLAAGQMAIWFDQTNGAAKLMVKAKEAGGTVRTGSVSLT